MRTVFILDVLFSFRSHHDFVKNSTLA